MKKNGDQFPKFNILRYHGDLSKAQTVEGIVVYRQEKLFVPELGRFIPCAPYDDHFIYEEPTKKIGRSSYMCTCGAAGIIAGISGYQGQQSPSGFLFICMYHGAYGVHATGGTKWI